MDTSRWIAQRNEEAGSYARRIGPWCKIIHPERLNVVPTGMPAYAGRSLGPEDLARAEVLFSNLLFWQEPSAGLYMLRDAYVWSKNGIVLSHRHEIFNEFSPGWASDVSRRRPYYEPFSLLQWTVRDLGGPAAVLALPGTDSHYHWLLQLLPRLHLMANVLGHIRYFIVPYDMTAIQEGTLNYYGISSERLVRIGAHEKIFCRQLFVSSIPANEGGVSDWALTFLRSNQRIAGRPVRKKLYLARGITRKRPIENEDEAVTALRSRGYEIIEGHKMTFAEQIQAMETAEIIVASHGAALTNMVFARDAKILEIFDPRVIDFSVFYPLSIRTGHRYWWTLGQAGAGDGIRIDIESLDLALSQVEAS